jgi:hypothetical protein
VAEDITDTFTIATGNKWVQTTSDSEKDQVTFSHKLSGVTSGEYGVDNLTPKFTESFTIPTYKVDEAGHITESAVETLTLPGITLTGSSIANDNVLVQLNLADDNTGAFEKTFAPVGDLKLTTYEKSEEADTANLTNDDSIVDAFNKIEHRLDAVNTTLTNEIENRKTADSKVLTDANSYTD